MKPKNMILVAVAVVCGLVAAFLTSQMSAKTKKVETIRVPVAAVEITTGTKIKADEFDKFVKFVEMPKEQAPQVFVETKEQLNEKWIVRTIRAGEAFNPSDVANNYMLSPPENFSAMTAPCSIEQGVAGFVKPSIDVDVIASVQLKKSQKWVVFPLFIKIKVLAVDSNSTPPQDGGKGYQNMSMVTFAVDKDTSLILHAALTRGAMLRLTLRHQDKPVEYKKITYEQIWDILTDRVEEKEELAAQTEKLKLQLVKLRVPTEDLKAGTKITEELLAEKFAEIERPKDQVPQNTVKDWENHLAKGDVILKDLASGHYVPKSFVGPKPEDETPAPTQPEEKPMKVQPKFDYHDIEVTTPTGIYRHRYLILPNGGYRYLGILDGANGSAPDEEALKDKELEPKAKSKPEGEGDKPGTKSETKPELKAKPKAKPQPKAEPKPETKPENEAKPNPLA